MKKKKQTAGTWLIMESRRGGMDVNWVFLCLNSNQEKHPSHLSQCLLSWWFTMSWGQTERKKKTTTTGTRTPIFFMNRYQPWPITIIVLMMRWIIDLDYNLTSRCATHLLHPLTIRHKLSGLLTVLVKSGGEWFFLQKNKKCTWILTDRWLLTCEMKCRLSIIGNCINVCTITDQ